MKIEELLGRPLIEPDDSRAGNYVSGKTVLITGAAGSVGSELARRMQAFEPANVILLDCAESGLYELEWEIRHFFPALPVEAVLCNVIDFQQLEKIFIEFQPEIIFHTAAYKQVPLLEKYPEQAVLTNILGTKNIADLALSYQAQKLIFISTDKAVNPLSVMGMSKKVAELYLGQHSHVVITRFGNVLGSNGSVVPLFEKQIQVGGPITLTHPDMTRYFMAISEAAQLVLEAGHLGGNGEIFWFNVAKPVRIADLAAQMIANSEKQVEIHITGIRAGEKIHEEWIDARHCRILQESPYLIAVEAAAPIDAAFFRIKINNLVAAAVSQDKDLVINLLKEMTEINHQLSQTV